MLVFYLFRGCVWMLFPRFVHCGVVVLGFLCDPESQGVEKGFS
jgi:hypothetical protein